jgi:hypothetical protein
MTQPCTSEGAAADAALSHLEPARAYYEPMVVKVEDAGSAWRVFFNNRAYIEGGDPSAALAGNWPLLVNKESGKVETDEAYRRQSLGLEDHG